MPPPERYVEFASLCKSVDSQRTLTADTSSMMDANARPHGALFELSLMSCHSPSERNAFAVNGRDSNDASVCTP